jgi:hypothetical protein
LIVFSEVLERRVRPVVAIAATGAAARRSALAGIEIHLWALTRTRGGCLREPPKPSRVNRSLSLLVLCFVPFLAGCKDPPTGASPSAQTSLVHAGTDIVVKNVRALSPGDNTAYSNDEYYIVTFTFTNNLGFALAPRPDHFVIEDQQKQRYLGADSGNANLSGISNYAGILKVGESHDYTIGFRVPQNTQGILYYDATF